MDRVTGIGGIFVRSKDPKTVTNWYREHLGLRARADVPSPVEPIIDWWSEPTPQKSGYTVWGAVPVDTRCCDPGDESFTLNFQVRDLDAWLARLREEGVTVLDRRDEDENGQFGYVLDPEGRLIELWEPAT